MDFIYTVREWLGVLVYLGLMVFCLTQVKRRGMALMAIGLGLIFISYLIWQFSYYWMAGGGEYMYQAMAVYDTMAILGFGALFVIGALQLAGPPAATSGERLSQRPMDPAACRNLGNVRFYVSMQIIGFVLAAVGTGGLIYIIDQGPYGQEAIILAMAIIAIIGALMLTAACIYFFVMLYRVWRFAIAACRSLGLPPAIDTPAKAVGFLFIPFFNLYWVFMAYGKLPGDLNAIARAKQVDASVSEGVGMALAIICVISVVPFINYVVGVVSIILMPVFVSRMVRMCRQLAAPPAEPAAPGEALLPQTA